MRKSHFFIFLLNVITGRLTPGWNEWYWTRKPNRSASG